MPSKHYSKNYYDLFLPVFKQGDDLAQHLSESPEDPAKAFLGLAERYQDAAQICKRVASVVKEAPAGSIEVQADTHMIKLYGSEEYFGGLVQDKIIGIEGPGDHEDEDSESDDDDSESDDEDEDEDEDEEEEG
jgi:hypothetical protein